MGQWLSQTRKLNTHYQSSGKGKTTGEGFYTTLPLGFYGSYFSDGTRAFLPLKVYEPGTTFYNSYGAIPWNTTGAFAQFVFHTETTGKDVYIGYYPETEYDIIGEPIATTENLLSASISAPAFTISGSTKIALGDRQSFTYNDMSRALIPHMKRWPVLFALTDGSTTPPEPFTTDAIDKGNCNDTLGEGTVGGTWIKLISDILPSEATNTRVRIPGKGVFGRTTSTYPTGAIAGTDLYRDTTGTRGTASLDNPVFSSASQYTVPAIPGICIGTYASTTTSTGWVTGDGAVTGAYPPSFSLIASGGGYTDSQGTEYGPGLSGYYIYSNSSLVNTIRYLYWRKIISFSVQDNFKFFTTT